MTKKALYGAPWAQEVWTREAWDIVRMLAAGNTDLDTLENMAVELVRRVEASNHA